jgi:hypothetical protein
MRTTGFIALALLIISCDRSMDASMTSAEDLQGVWLLYERGYSPGAGYITEPVAANPPQTITFIDNRQIVNTLDGSQAYKFYTAERDAADQITRLKLFMTDPDLPQVEGDRIAEFIVEQTQDTMKLMQIGCIEGCHLGFRRSDQSVD